MYDENQSEALCRAARPAPLSRPEGPVGDSSNAADRRVRLEAFLSDLRRKCITLGMPRRFAFSLSTEKLMDWWVRADCIRLGASASLVATMSLAGLRALHAELVDQRVEEREGVLRYLMERPPESAKAA